MAGLKPLSARKVIQKLVRAGFEKTHQRGSHVYLIKDKRIVTVPTHGSKDIPIGTLYNIVVRQSGLAVETFNKL